MPDKFSVHIHGNPPIWCEIKPRVPIRIAVLGDIHAPFHDPQALQLAIEIIKSIPLDILIFNGDCVDFFAISRFSKDPKRRLELVSELRAAKKVFQHILHQLPSVSIIYLSGNHEDRLKAYLWSKAPELSELDKLIAETMSEISGMKFREHNILPILLGLPPDTLFLSYADTPMPDNELAAPTVKVGKLLIAHGDTFRLNGNTVNVARCLFQRVLRNILICHWHRADRYEQTDIFGHLHGAYVSPCLSLPRPHWDTSRLWTQGFSIIEVAPDGFFKVDIITFIRQNGHKLAYYAGTRFSVKTKGGIRS